MALRGVTNKIKGIVVSRVETGEGDLMVRLFSSTGPLSFFAKGALKLKSKNRPSLSPLSEGEYSLRLGPQGGLALEEGVLLRPHAPDGDFEKAMALSFLSELSNKSFLEAMPLDGEFETYYVLGKFLDLLEKGFDPLSAMALYLAHILKAEGLGLEVSSCVRTKGKRGIAGLSWEEGGFLTKEAIEKESERRSPYELKVVRYLFLVPLSKMGEVSFEKAAAIRFLKEGSAALKNALGIDLKSLSGLKLL